MINTQAGLFKTNQNQAIHMPKAVAFPESIKKVSVVAFGNTRIITPIDESWDECFDGPGISDDFMSAREQPGDQIREPL
uniref:Antitoxin VapB n=1 Tax=Candidatus Kentrum sp. UNK TaxID=2126344 RepID=A0A451APE6_9GAMM|nr:MAG: antitoxin VapB [Candidatus Kentron sp. UNK]VFK73209.1 MAG: antitoxin VapB [Candidatus Kentron sp. UNK]